VSDIVERLLNYSKDDHERGCAGRCYDCSCGYDDKRDPLMVEAADEITRLRARVAELEEALKRIGQYDYPRVPSEYEDECTHEVNITLGCHDCMAAYARATLKEGESNG
jgi:hypothetical protein